MLAGIAALCILTYKINLVLKKASMKSHTIGLGHVHMTVCVKKSGFQGSTVTQTTAV